MTLGGQFKVHAHLIDQVVPFSDSQVTRVYNGTLKRNHHYLLNTIRMQVVSNYAILLTATPLLAYIRIVLI